MEQTNGTPNLKKAEEVDLSDFFANAKLESEKNPEIRLQPFQEYSAMIPQEIINSTSVNSEKMMVRKGFFLQLIFELADILDHEEEAGLTGFQHEVISKFIQEYTSDTFREQKLVKPEDISNALLMLELFDLDMSKQRAELASSKAFQRDSKRE